MVTIEQGRPGCTVMVTVDARAEVMPELEAHAKYGLAQFPSFKGYLGGALHRSTDGKRLVQYLQWDSEMSYQSCIQDARWDEAPTTKRFKAYLKSGRATVDEKIFDVIG